MKNGIETIFPVPKNWVEKKKELSTGANREETWATMGAKRHHLSLLTALLF